MPNLMTYPSTFPDGTECVIIYIPSILILFSVQSSGGSTIRVNSHTNSNPHPEGPEKHGISNTATFFILTSLILQS
jgi:hypothetical protein